MLRFDNQVGGHWFNSSFLFRCLTFTITANQTNKIVLSHYYSYGINKTPVPFSLPVATTLIEFQKCPFPGDTVVGWARTGRLRITSLTSTLTV